MTMKRVLQVGDFDVQQAGSLVGSREIINIVNGSGEVTVTDNVGATRVDITILNLDKIPDNKPILNADVDAAAAIAKSKISTSGTWAASDIPTLDASKIGTGILVAARGGLGENLNEAAKADDTIIVYKSTADEFIFEAKGTPSAHKDSHDPATGGDPLDTGVPVNVSNAANATGTADTLARSDHKHDVDFGTPSNIGTANAAGSSASLALSDHVHDHISGLGANLHHNQAHASDHLVGGSDALSVGTPSNIGTVNSAGSLTNFVRRDHVHAHPNLASDLHTVYVLADGTRVLTDPLRYEQASADPSPGASDHGWLWFRDDLGVFKYSRDDGASGTEIVTINADGETNFFAAGMMATIDVDSFVASTGGTGTFTKEALIGELETGSTSGDKKGAQLQWMDSAGDMSGEAGYPIYDQFPEFELYIRLATIVTQDMYIIWGGKDNSPDLASEKKFGIHIANADVKTFSSDGTTQSETASQQTLLANQWYKIRVKRNSSAIKLWIDGVAKTDKTTNIPSGAADDTSVIQVHAKTNSAAVKKIFFRPIKLYTRA